MKRFLRKMVVGTPWENATRHAYASLFDMPARRIYGEDKAILYDEQTVEVMKRSLKEDSNCVDVGCHQGTILREMLQIAPRGKHHAYEPIPYLYEELRSNFGHHEGLKISDVALSDNPGTVSFQHVLTNPAWSGLRQRSYARPDEKVETITVRTERLDDVIERDLPIHLLKIDVEGAEVLVLRGAVETIRRHRPIVIFEHGLGATDHYGFGPDDVYDLLVDQCGLRLSLMGDWLESGGRGALSRKKFARRYSKWYEYYYMAHP